MSDTAGLAQLLIAIADGDRDLARTLLNAVPSLATDRLARRDEFFIGQCHAQVYEGDTALHAAAFAYDGDMASELVTSGADVRARNRRGAEPLHAAVTGVPGAANWNPTRQKAVIEYLIGAGADPNAAALGGVTPLHRAVRNRCSAAVEALLRAGADPEAANDRASTPSDLSRRTTGRGGAGSPAAKAEQSIIIDLLSQAATPHLRLADEASET
jgi:ankyrin repeat protein